MDCFRAWFGSILFVMVLGTAGRTEAQVPFRRGDVNVDGVVDISDGARYLGWETPSCWDAADANGDGFAAVGAFYGVVDPIYLLSYLFLDGESPPAPGPDVPGVAALDPTPIGCSSYDPSPPPKLADVAFGFDACPHAVSGANGQVVAFDVFVTLTTTSNSHAFGPEAWSFGLVIEGGTLKSVSKTNSLGGVAVSVLDADLGSEVLDLDKGGHMLRLPVPAQNPETGDQGAVSAIVLAGPPGPSSYTA